MKKLRATLALIIALAGVAAVPALPVFAYNSSFTCTDVVGQPPYRIQLKLFDFNDGSGQLDTWCFRDNVEVTRNLDSADINKANSFYWVTDGPSRHFCWEGFSLDNAMGNSDHVETGDAASVFGLVDHDNSINSIRVSTEHTCLYA